MTRTIRTSLALLALASLNLATVGPASAGEETDFSYVTLARPDVCYATTGCGYPFFGSLLTIDPSTGQGTLVGPSDIFGSCGLPGLAIQSTGEIFATNRRSDPFSKLFRLDAATGKAYEVAPLTHAADASEVVLEGIAFNASDVLYGVSASAESLFTVDTSTGVATKIGAVVTADSIPVQPEIRGLAFDPMTGTLWASTGSNDEDIYTINTTTGEATLIGNTGVGNSIPDIHFDSSGNLFGVTKGSFRLAQGGPTPFDLISIDKTDGSGTVIGATGFSSVSGLAYRQGCDPFPVSARHGNNEQAIHLGTTKDPGWNPCGPSEPTAKKCWVARFDIPTDCAGLLSCLTIASAGNDSVQVEVALNDSILGFLEPDLGDVDEPNCSFVTTQFDSLSLPAGPHKIEICNLNPQVDFIFHDVTFGCPQDLMICPDLKTDNFSSSADDSVAIEFTGVKDDVQGFALDLLFDPNHLTYVRVDSSAFTGPSNSWGIIPSLLGDGVDPDTVRIQATTTASGGVMPSNGEILAYVVFTKETGAFTQTTVEARTVTLGTVGEGTIPLPDCDGVINFSACPKDGDIDGDNDIDFNDVFCTFRCVQLQQTGQPPMMPPNTSCSDTPNAPCEGETADLSCNGECDAFDLLWIVDRFSCAGGPLECGAVVDSLFNFVTPPCPPSPFLPPLVRTLGVGELDLRPGETARVPLELAGRGTLRAFSIDLGCPEGLEVVGFERSERTAAWMGLAQTQPNPGEVRLVGFDARGLDLAGDVATSLGSLVIRATGAPVSGKFELAKVSGPGLQGMRLLGGEVAAGDPAPTEFALGRPRPNPFRGSVSIEYTVPGLREHVELKVYNIQGQVVKTLVNEVRAGGRHQVEWSGQDDSGARVASGTYFYRMKSGSFEATEKIIRTR